MTGNLRIFVSSTCDDLFQERRYLVEAFLGQGHAVVVSERGDAFPVSPRLSTVENCIDAISRHADLVVLVVSNRYGSDAGGGMSVTEAEIARAKALGLPVYSFVRKQVWALLPIYRATPTTDFKPLVPDNRVLAMIDRIAGATSGSWVFPFEDAKEIADIVKYQISADLKRRIDEARSTLTGEIFYNYTNNTNLLLSSDGSCRRSLEYEIVNGSAEVVTAIHGGETSGAEISSKDMKLAVHSEDGTLLSYEFTFDSPRYKRWEIIFPRPLLPGERFRYFCSWLSIDRNETDTGHTRRGASGFIQFVYPSGTISKITEVALRTNAGWVRSPPGVIRTRTSRYLSIAHYYRNTEGYWRFRVRWK
jgi:hypothetical protein